MYVCVCMCGVSIQKCAFRVHGSGNSLGIFPDPAWAITAITTQLLQMPEKASLPLVSLGGAISAPAPLVFIFLALTDILEA